MFRVQMRALRRSFGSFEWDSMFRALLGSSRLREWRFFRAAETRL
jgi:hypothetical protein